MIVVALAGNVMTGLAKGLRKKFSSYASSCMSAIFEKFKEKKLNVVTSLREAADAIYLTVSFTSFFSPLGFFVHLLIHLFIRSFVCLFIH